VTQNRKAAAVESLEDRRLMSVVFGLQAKNTIVAVDSGSPETVLATLRVKRGLSRGETLRGIDFRPADNRLYGLGSTNRLYTIDTVTGEATAVGTSTFAVNLTGTEFGFDFDSNADALRVVSDANENFRLLPNGTLVDADTNTPGTQTDGALTYIAGDVNAGQDPAVIGVAYTNNDTDAATPTTLFGIDAARNVLVRQGSPDGTPISPNAGTLFTVGPLGTDAEAVGGFDIQTSAGTNRAFAALTSNLRQPSQLFTVDLNTGAATPIGNIGRTRRPVLGIAVTPAGRDFFLVTQHNELLALNDATPSLVLSRDRITGLTSPRERIVGMDFRPSTGLLWALSNAGQQYIINTATAVASPFGAPSDVPLDARASYGYDFNPTADRIRVTNSAGQNVRYDPTTGAAVDFDPAAPGINPDTGLAYVPGDSGAGATPRIVGSAYTNNLAGGTPTTLYDIDSARDVLATQGSVGGTPTSPNNGQLFTVGSTNVNVPDAMGFDIVTEASVDKGFAVFAPGGRGTTNLYSVNLVTGQLDLVSALSKKVKGVAGFAIKTGP
jgi:hypothetical protein